jgi:phage tail-like protein
MDANETRFHLLLGREDWARCTGAGDAAALFSPAPSGPPPADGDSLRFHFDTGRYELMLQPRRFEFAASPFDVRPELGDRRGAGCDRFGNWYWIGESRREILVNSAGTRATSHFWGSGDAAACKSEAGAGFQPIPEPAPPPLLELSGLAVTEDHYLAVGTANPGELLIFDLYGGGAPRRMLWPAPFLPLDMAPRPGGGLFILGIDRRFWALDRSFGLCPPPSAGCAAREALFQPLAGRTRRLTPEDALHQGVSLGEGSPGAGSPPVEMVPIAIEALPDRSVLILERTPDAASSRIRRFSPDGKELGRAELETGMAERSGLGAHDFAFVPRQPATGATREGRLYVAGREGNQAVSFALSFGATSLELAALTDYLPMRLFGGKGVVVSGAQVFYDFGDRWIPLTRQNRPCYLESATLVSYTLDGREPECVWHRLLFDGCIPPETAVSLWSRAANDRDELDAAPWQEEPPPYRRGDGSELPFVPSGGTDSYETLFQQARGRYLQLKIALAGNGRATPRLRALRVYYPRFSYLEQYLPALYREDAASASFLDRFLANLEGIHTALEDKIAAAQILFDPRTAPPEALDWLASWFDIALDPAWDERRQRLFIRHAMDFFQYRGTIRGLQMALRLALDECVDDTIFTDVSIGAIRQSPIRIVERFRTRRTPGLLFGDTSEAESGPGTVTPAARWSPGQRRDALRRRYADWGAAQHTSAAASRAFPIGNPGGEAAPAWEQFSKETLGFVPSAGKDDLKLWQDFLARRYRSITACNGAYGASWPSFEAVPLPATLPPDGPPLLDWYQFESVVLPMRRSAHRFTVLLPTPRSGTSDTDEYQRRLGLARRIVELEKPAHSVYSIKFYWAMFRVGEARVGYDTMVDLGSRAPEFMAAMVLGREHLGESFIGLRHPQLKDRYWLGEIHCTTDC